MRVGIDIIKIARVEKAVRKYGIHGLRVFMSDVEIKHSSMAAQSIAGQWAAKEAVIKAIGYWIPFTSIEVLKTELGSPYVMINKEAADHITISITHDGDYAVAVAILV